MGHGGNGFKLTEDEFRLDTGKKSFDVRILRPRHRLPREVGDAPTLESVQGQVEWSLD